MDTTLSADEIRVRAYLLWEADGCQQGRDDHYWHEATVQLERECADAPDGAAIGAVAAPDALRHKADNKVAAKKAANVVAANIGQQNGLATTEEQRTEDRRKKVVTKSEAKSDTKADLKTKAGPRMETTTKQKMQATEAARKQPKRSRQAEAS